MTLASFLKSTEKYVQDNSPTILTAFGVVGTISTAILAGKAAYKARDVIEAENKRFAPKQEPYLSDKEKFQLTWKLYIPAASTGMVTIACIIAANRIGSRRAAALAAAYSISEKAISEYKAKVIEKLGANKDRDIRDELAQNRVNQNPVTKSEVIVTGNGEVLCYDQYSGRYFESSMEEIKRAQNDTNYQIIRDNFASLGDFYDRLGLGMTKYSEEVGWNTDHPLEIMFSTTLSDDKRPCLSMDYQTTPTRGYQNFH